MAEGEDFASAGAEAVEDTVWGDDEFADVGACEFGDHAAEAWMGGKGIGGVEEALTPFGGDGGASGFADFAENATESTTGAGCP